MKLLKTDFRKENKYMNTPIILLLKDEAVDSLMKAFSESKLKPYSDEDRRKTNAKVEEILKNRKRKRE